MRDKIQQRRTQFVVGNIVSGRIFSENYTVGGARDRLANMTDSIGYKIYTRKEWEDANVQPDPYEEASALLRKAIECFDGIDEEEARKVVNANLGMRGRLEGIKDQIDTILRRL